MTKIMKFLLFIFGLLCLMILAFPLLNYQLEQPQQRQLQTKILNSKSIFSEVQLQKGQVLLVPGRRCIMRGLDRQFFLFNKPLPFSVGSQFEASDRHWGATYTVRAIERDGVVVYFDASGQKPAAIRPSSGTVKIIWK